MAFVKVVGGSEIYNFRIQCFVHFSTKVWRNFRSKSPSLKHSRPGRRRAATLHAGGLGVCTRAPPEAAPFLGVRAPNAPRFLSHARVALTVTPSHARYTRAD
jgi:hypothetical protein